MATRIEEARREAVGVAGMTAPSVPPPLPLHAAAELRAHRDWLPAILRDSRRDQDEVTRRHAWSSTAGSACRPSRVGEPAHVHFVS